MNKIEHYLNEDVDVLNESADNAKSFLQQAKTNLKEIKRLTAEMRTLKVEFDKAVNGTLKTEMLQLKTLIDTSVLEYQRSGLESRVFDKPQKYVMGKDGSLKLQFKFELQGDDFKDLKQAIENLYGAKTVNVTSPNGKSRIAVVNLTKQHIKKITSIGSFPTVPLA